MKGMLAHARARLSARRGRALLAAGGIAAASAMLGAAVTVSFGLATGFERAAARANLPDAIARFDPLPAAEVEARAEALPNVAAAAYRLERQGVPIAAGGEYEYARVEGVREGPRGYAIVEGRDLTGGSHDVVVERGLAREWNLHPGDRLQVDGAGARVVGVAVRPDTVAFPLTAGPRIWAPYATVARGSDDVNLAQLWVRDRDRLDVTLAQARAASFGIRNLEFVTRDGVRVLIGQAAGIVIALLVAVSLVALAAAGVVLAASSAADVQRRLPSIGIVRALGGSPGHVALGHALEGALVALPAGTLGLAAGALVVERPTARLLETLNELPPGRALLLPLALALAAVVALVAGGSAWPAWRAARRSPAETLRGADLVSSARRLPLPAGAVGLGARLVLARPLRTALTVLVLAASASVVLLLLSLASLLTRLERDPTAVGKRYSLTVASSAEAADEVARVPGVAGAAARYETEAADSFHLGEAFELVAFRGEHERFEAPPLAEGRRLRGGREAEVGVGLAQTLGLGLGSVLAAQLSSGEEVRFRVVGLVGALEREGRIAFVAPEPLVAAGVGSSGVAVVLRPGAGKEAVAEQLRERGYSVSSVGGVTLQNGGFLSVLAALLRSVAVVDGLVCLYALVQMLALTAHERRAAVALVRALGGSPRHVAALLGGAAFVIVALTVPAAVLLERLVVGPAAARLAAGYVTLPLAAGGREIAVVVAGLVALAFAAAAWVRRGALREPVVAGLRSD